MLGNKVLVVDDDPDMLALVGAWLRSEQYEVVTAGDALACVQQAQREQPDVIVLDLGLPAGGGHVALERLKRNPRTAAVPVVVLTASQQAADLDRAADLGAVDVLPKAGDKTSLLAAIQKSVDSSQVADSFPGS